MRASATRSVDPVAAEASPVEADVARAEPTDAELDALVGGITTFGTELFAVAESDRNVVLSPVSIAMAFGMARAGADGTTAQQMDEVFGFPGGAATHASFNALDRVLAEAAPAELSQARPDATRSPEEPDPPRSRSPTASSPRSASRSARSI